MIDAMKYLLGALFVWAWSLDAGWVLPLVLVEAVLLLCLCSALGRAVYDHRHPRS